MPARYDSKHRESTHHVGSLATKLTSSQTVGHLSLVSATIRRREATVCDFWYCPLAGATYKQLRRWLPLPVPPRQWLGNGVFRIDFNRRLKAKIIKILCFSVLLASKCVYRYCMVNTSYRHIPPSWLTHASRTKCGWLRRRRKEAGDGSLRSLQQSERPMQVA
jgi:hypothetical protein